MAKKKRKPQSRVRDGRGQVQKLMKMKIVRTPKKSTKK